MCACGWRVRAVALAQTVTTLSGAPVPYLLTAPLLFCLFHVSACLFLVHIHECAHTRARAQANMYTTMLVSLPLGVARTLAKKPQRSLVVCRLLTRTANSLATPRGSSAEAAVWTSCGIRRRFNRKSNLHSYYFLPSLQCWSVRVCVRASQMGSDSLGGVLISNSCHRCTHTYWAPVQCFTFNRFAFQNERFRAGPTVMCCVRRRDVCNKRVQI